MGLAALPEVGSRSSKFSALKMVFPAKEHVAKTLRELFALLPEQKRTKAQLILLSGEVTPYRNDTDREMPFRQESNFYWLSGCLVPSSHLLIISTPGSSVEKNPTIDLFIPPVLEDDITWSVPPPTPSEAVVLFPEATKILPSDDLSLTLKDTFKAFPDAILHTLPNSRLFPTHPSNLTQETSIWNAAKEDLLLTALHRARLIKSDWEIAQIRKANDISSRAHETVMRVLAEGVKKQYQTPADSLLPKDWDILKEQDAEAIFVAACHRQGAIRQAYLPIVASSVRASTLHYCCNDKAFAWGPIEANKHSAFVHPYLHVGGAERSDESRGIPNGSASGRGSGSGPSPQVLLIDAGCEWENYASDITRTMPVGNGGKFTDEVKAIYSTVLEMQEESIKAIKPGVHWDAIHLLCHRILIRSFIALSIFKNDTSSGPVGIEERILNSGITAAFFPHGLGHSLGLDVHDVPSVSKPDSGEGRSTLPDTLPKKAAHGIFKYLRLRLPLEKGMVVTVEPGIYFSPHLLAPIRSSELINHEVLARYEYVGGIRIEDAVAVTQDGCDLLTKVGKSVEWIEGVCSGTA